MDRESAWVKDAEPRRPAARGSRRLLIAVAVAVLLAVIAVLAFRLSNAAPTVGRPAARRRGRPSRPPTGNWTSPR
jgi:hypothetical protein